MGTLSIKAKLEKKTWGSAPCSGLDSGASEAPKIVIAGAGIMGASMAQIFARRGYSVTLYDIAQEGIDKGRELIAINQRALIGQGELDEDLSREVLSRIAYTTIPDAFKETDFVIEAIVENMAVKLDFWKEVSRLAPDGAVLTTNTSGLSITEISAAVRLPERFCGMHWVNPPHIAPLVEVIQGESTAEETVEAVREAALSVHRHPVTVRGDPRGFVLNRLQFAVLREALHIVENGYATAKDVDDVMKYGLGMRYSCIGPFETVDLGGLDTFYKVGSYLFAELSNVKDVLEPLAALYREGAFGTKTGRGFYDYGDGGAERAIEKRDKAFLKVAKCLYEDLL
ncbi:MAG: 3-hydroxyacyl-CoA dehydrogenase family protein [Synergistaceae bacterium]|jgi:3-hydroxybutyryl-CoA dehydrogenase|nr:3-hydroxyacyl-CoA dehydrogenase family protein [Synergistaceae bacterium]